MRVTNLSHRLGLFVAVAMLVGCGAQQQSQVGIPNGTQASLPQGAVRHPMPQNTWFPMPPTGRSRGGWLSPIAKAPASRLLYVSDDGGNDVLVFPERGHDRHHIGRITSGVSGPWGLYEDNQENLYVANQSGTVTVYPRGSTSPSVTYSQGLARPLYPIVDSSGDLFVGNAASYSSYYSSNGGTVVEYQPGSTTPYQVLQTPGDEVDGMDFDRQGNLYVAYRGGYTSGSIEEFAPGSSQGKVLGMSLDQPQGLVVDNVGDILVVESQSARMDVFPPGSQTPSIEVGISDIPNQLAIRRTEPRLFIAAEEGTVYGLRYPLKRKNISVYVKEGIGSLLQGVALSNEQQP